MAKKPKKQQPKDALGLQAEIKELNPKEARRYGTNPSGDFPQLEDEFPGLVTDLSAGDSENGLVEYSLEELEALEEENRRGLELATDGPIDTQHTDGSAYYADQADEQGLVYTPPDDPPILPDDSPQGVRIAAGWSKDLEVEDDPRAEDLPDRFSRNDADLQEKIYTALANNGETMDLTELRVEVENGIVSLYGRVPTLLDVDLVENLVRDLDGVIDVEERLEVAGLV